MTLVGLHQAILPHNTHWQTGKASPLVRKHPTARRSFRHIRKRIHEPPYEVLAGPRQVGKTTLVGNLIDDLLQRDVLPQRILFIPCDLPAVALETAGQAEPFIRLLEERILHSQLSSLDTPAFLFLDEVHELDDWSRQLKALYDTYHPWLRVFATGSSSVSLLNPPTADLAGRVRTSQIYPLKFNEAVEAFVDVGSTAYDQGRSVRETLRLPLDADGLETLRKGFDKLHGTLLPHQAQLQTVLERYLIRGGFPAALTAEQDDDAFLFLEQTVDLVLSRDLASHPRVRKAHAFRTFLAVLARQHSGKFVPAQIANQLDLDRSTTSSWKQIAEELFIVQQLPALNHHFNPLPAKNDKAYIIDPGIRAYLSSQRTLDALELSGWIGQVVEGIVHDHVRRLQFNLFTSRNNRLGYLSRPEIDLVADTPGGWLALEVKYTHRPTTATRALERIDLAHENVLRIVLTRDTYDTSSNVWVLPVWLFCFVC